MLIEVTVGCLEIADRYVLAGLLIDVNVAQRCAHSGWYISFPDIL